MSARHSIDDFSWPIADLGDAVEQLCREVARRRLPSTPDGLQATVVDDPHAFGRDLDRVVSAFDLEAEPVSINYGDADRLQGPLIVRLPAHADVTADARFSIVWRATRSTMTLLRRDGRWLRVARTTLVDALRAVADAEGAGEIQRLFATLAIHQRRASAIRRALLAERSGDRHVTDAWLLRPEPGIRFRSRLREERIIRDTVVLFTLHAVQFGLWILAWGAIGRSALDGRTEGGWLAGWILLLATIVPLQSLTAWLQGMVGVRAGRLLKERLLVGALRLEPEAIRSEGAGRLLGRAIESDAVEALAISGGFRAGLAGIELAMAAAVLAAGVAPVGHVLALAGILGAVAIVTWRYHLRRREWTMWRLNETHALVERVAGHRTRLAQEMPERWHVDEDRGLEEYVERSSKLDRLLPVLSIALPRIWMAMALIILAPAIVAGTSAAALAVSVGGLLLAFMALGRFADGLSQVSGALIAWRQVHPVFDAAAKRPSFSEFAETAGRPIATQPILDVRNVGFRYSSRPKPVLRSCTLQVRSGDRILLQGPSGGGKSTFASLVAGLRTPDSGLILLGGLDKRTLGEHGWRRRAVAAPQFHENHVFAETFAFNLLMGRRWPPTDDDLAAAEAIVAELGLSRLVNAMPAGLLQVVGEGGWRLSHGERSRLFMARALLQGGDLVILDESFAALDPANLRNTLDCVLRRAPTLLVVAHP